MSNYEVRFTRTASKDVNKLTPKLKIKLREDSFYPSRKNSLRGLSFNLPWVNSPPLGSALIFFYYKESPARPKEPKAPRTWESVRNTPLLAAGIGWTSGDYLLTNVSY